jgi:hypothetical protein
MAMMLLDTVCAEVEPVPGRKGWFQLTGRNIRRAVAFEEFLTGCKTGTDHIVADARVLGLHDEESVISGDDRFNGRLQGSFAVIKQGSGGHLMVLDVHMPEAVLLRFILPATQPERDDPLPRIEARSPKPKASPRLRGAPVRRSGMARTDRLGHIS